MTDIELLELRVSKLEDNPNNRDVENIVFVLKELYDQIGQLRADVHQLKQRLIDNGTIAPDVRELK
jgi:hypothetical protein